MSTPDQDVAGKITGNQIWGTTVATLGTSLFYGPERPQDAFVPARALFCLSSGGATPERYLGGAGSSYYRFDVQVISRGGVGESQLSLTGARAALTLLQEATFSGYVGQWLRDPEPIFLGLNDQDQPRWSFVLSLGIVE